MPADVILSVGVVWREDDEEEENFELESLEGKDSIQLRNLIIIVVVLHGMAKPRKKKKYLFKRNFIEGHFNYYPLDTLESVLATWPKFDKNDTIYFKVPTTYLPAEHQPQHQHNTSFII